MRNLHLRADLLAGMPRVRNRTNQWGVAVAYNQPNANLHQSLLEPDGALYSRRHVTLPLNDCFKYRRSRV